MNKTLDKDIDLFEFIFKNLDYAVERIQDNNTDLVEATNPKTKDVICIYVDAKTKTSGWHIVRSNDVMEEEEVTITDSQDDNMRKEDMRA